jgi:putative nucleotidyltransferase with HDIG domain
VPRSADTLPRGASYVAATTGAGLLVVADSLVQVLHHPPGFQWLVLAALTLLTGSFTVKLPSLPARLSVSETFVFTSILLFGPSAGTLIVVVDALVISFWMNSAKRRPSKVLFNAAAPAIAIRVASEAFFAISGAHPGTIGRNEVGHLILPVFALALIYFVINATLVAGAVSAETSTTITTVWLRNFSSVSINYFVGSSIAMLLVAYTDRIDFAVLGMIVPLLLIFYLTFRSSLGRLEDATRHVAQVNELYLSTIETLAMAVDAKDQITHGHIRRVQVYAIELARRLGVSEPEQLKAIEAAALLHDMGKLAIPEHILNKPGKLTDAEFAIMQRHADLGAELLSQVKFPYPVVPIVRHHHENWDGSGYPARIGGTDIPIGARILSVVDCFDALTSDRPYRPRLSSERAFEIIRERSGWMYDPLIVDVFIKCYADVAPLANQAGLEARTLFTGFNPEAPTPSPLDNIYSSASTATLIIECASRLAEAQHVNEIVEVASGYIRQLTPATVVAFYRHDAPSDTLRCQAVIGDPSGYLLNLTIPLGQRISGWAASNRRESINSDARLDLIQVAEQFSPSLRSTFALPLSEQGRLIGVLTLYATKENAFSAGDRYVLQEVATRVGVAMARSTHRSAVVRFRAFPEEFA